MVQCGVKKMKTFEAIARELSAPFPEYEVNFRVGSTTKDKKKGKPLAYIDARAVMDRLDEVLGCDGWQDRFDCVGGKTICYLSVKIGDEWVTKADGAGDTAIEGEKGGISDALKRAAVKWGIGRYLYHWDFNWMPLDAYKKLDGNPWEYKKKTSKEQYMAARDFANNWKNLIADAKEARDLLNLQTDNQKFLDALRKYPELHQKTINVTNSKRSEFNGTVSG